MSIIMFKYEILSTSWDRSCGGNTSRHNLFLLNLERLEEKAYKAINILKYNPDDIAIVCIYVDDPAWSELVDELMPKYDWDQYRNKNMLPIARGSVYKDDIVEYISMCVPAVKVCFNMPPRNGCLYTLVLAEGGVSIYEISYQRIPYHTLNKVH